MAWIELHQAIARHPKTYELARILSQRRSTIIGMLCLLWLWALDNKTSQVTIDAGALSDVMDWPGDKELLLKALIAARWLDHNEQGLFIHDWEEYIDKLLLLRESNRKRQQAHRERNKHLLLSSKNVTVTSRVTSRVSNGATVPNQTVPNHIKEIYIKKKYGEFQNVLLADNEYQKLHDKFNSQLPDLLERLSQGIASKGYKYKNHYATILSWVRKDEKEGKQNATNRPNSTIIPKVYTEPPVDPVLQAAVAARERNG